MKKIKYLIFILILGITGCEKVLDKEPLDIISDVIVWKDANLVNAYLNDIYYRIQFQDMRDDPGYSQSTVAAMGGECRVMGAWQQPYQAATSIITETGAHEAIEYWKYDIIRDINFFVEKLGDESSLNQAYKEQKLSEARFLRAWVYFQMVIRYGGVPILTKAQIIDTPAEDLFVSRNSEKEVYDFIISEMDAVSEILPEVYGVDDIGRPSKWAALSLKGRAALYAASIAKYSTVQLDGLLGFPASDITIYAQKAYSASKEIIESGYHKLYNVLPDKMYNYQNLFLDESSANKEIIFAQKFDYGLGLGHSLSQEAIPAGFETDWGSNFFYFYDFVELFEYVDGRPGNSISRSELVSREFTIEELFGNRDPRFRASIFYPESPWQGSKVLFHLGTLVNGKLFKSGVAPDGWPYKAPNRNTLRTGFELRKRLDESHIKPRNLEDDTDYMIFRLGETYLNLAEAAFYLGLSNEALGAINTLRARAGMPSKTEITENNIRIERQVELTFEDHRYWDLRRWRIAAGTLNGVRLQGLSYVYNYDTKKYKISLINGEGAARVFQERNYYLPIGIARLADNPNLVENPGY